MSFRGLILLDRDGTINKECCYLSNPEDVELLPHAADGICRMRELGLAVAIVTNQSGVARGMFDLDRLDAIHRRLRELLRREGASVDGIYLCPHRPDEDCACRKPAPGLARRAAEELQTGAAPVFVVGDKPCDIDLGRNIGAVTILVRTGYGAEFARDEGVQADHVVSDLLEAAAVVGAWLDGVDRPATGETER